MNQLLKDWIAAEARVMKRVRQGVGVGIATHEQMSGMTGREIIEKMLAGELPISPIAPHLSFCTIEVGDGNAVFQGNPRRKHLNPMGTVHGGWMTTLLDSTLGTAVLSSLEAGKAYTTMNIQMKFLKRLMPDVGRVRARGRVLPYEPGARSVTAEGELFDVNGTVYATAVCQCRVFRTQ